MSFYYSHTRELNDPPPESEFREILINSLTLDRFLKYHNGNLPALFRKTKKDAHGDDDHINEEDYLVSSEFAKSLKMTDSYQHDLLKETIVSYENFKHHLRSASAEKIDYTYLWDVMCDVNRDLMPRGLNLILIRTEHGRAQIVCPTSAYSSMQRLDPEKETVIVLQEEKEEGGEDYIPLLTPQVTLRNIPPKLQSMAEKCSPQSGLPPNIYPFRESMSAQDVKRILVDEGSAVSYQIVQQVVSGSAKVVALLIKSQDVGQQTLYVPCRPSVLLESGEPTVPLEKARAKLLSYEVTRDRLLGLSYATGGQIPCKPRYKVVATAGGTRVQTGLMTEANEFVPTIESSKISDDDLEVVSGEDVAQKYDETLTDPSTLDATEDMDAIAFRLESQFYHLYEGIVKMLLSQNSETKQAWVQHIQSVSVSYQNKLKFIETQIRELVKNHVHFQTMDASLMKDVHDMVACTPPPQRSQPTVDSSSSSSSVQEEEEEESKERVAKYCLTLEDGSQQTLFPKTNLVDPLINNETMYAVRLADEILRVRRTQMAILFSDDQSGSMQTMSGVSYNLNENEIVVPLSQMAETIKKNATNKDTVTVWDTATPSSTPMEAMDSVEFLQSCISKTDRPLQQRSKWKKVFPRRSTEIVFVTAGVCAFAPLLYLAKSYRKKPMSVASVREILWKSYSAYFDISNEKYKERDIMLDILRMATPEEVKKRVLEDENFVLTDADCWMFCQQLHIPAFLIWTPPASSTRTDAPWLRLYGEQAENTSYYFIHKHLKRRGMYTIVSVPFSLSELNTTLLRDEQGHLVIHEI